MRPVLSAITNLNPFEKLDADTTLPVNVTSVPSGSEATLLIENAEYTRCEIELAARREMIVKLEDFMRRRSKIELVVKNDEIVASPGLREACEILFPGEAQERLQEYLAELGKR